MRHTARILGLTVLLAISAMPAFANWVAVEGYYTTQFLSVTYNDNGTSTWRYQLTWDPTKPADGSKNPALSHFGVEFCGTARVIDFSPKVGGPIQSVEIGPDPSLANMGCTEGVGFFGIKWNTNGEALPYPAIFEFTLDQHYAVGLVRTAAKAGQDCNIGTIYGPSLNCEIADPELTLDKSCTADVFVGDKISYSITVTNSGNVPLTDVVVSDPIVGVNEKYAQLAPGESHVINVTADATEVKTIVNTATASGDYFKNYVNATDSCTSTVWDIAVSKTANTRYTRDFDWSIGKTADPFEVYPVDEQTGNPLLDFCAGSALPLDFQIVVDQTYTDSAWGVSGTITVSNPAPIDATLLSVVDVISGGFNATVSCPAFVVPAGGSLVCTYEAPLADAEQRINTATATLTNGHSVSGTADVVFGSPTTVIDGTVTVTDTVTCPAGFTCTPSGPFTFSAAGTQTYSSTITNVDAMCGSFYDIANVVTIVETGQSAGASAVIKTCACGHGCTLTIGYWKTHAGFTGRNADVVSQYLPVWLGTAGGAKSLQVTTAQQAVNVLSMKTYGEPSNGITKLYAQLLAAKLNVLNGASSDDISKELAKADAFLAMYDYTAWYTLKANVKKDIINWMSTFDAYNNGLVGPGHCD